MLAALVPGIREIRAPVTAGSLILVSLYLFFTGTTEAVANQAASDPSVSALSDLLGRTGWIAVGAVVAYLVGSVYVGARNAIEHWSAAKLAEHATSAAYLDAPKALRHVFAPFSRPSVRRLGALRDSAYDQRLAHEVCIDIIFGGGRRLQVANASLYDQYDRLTTEAAFRDAVSIPGLLLVASVAPRIHYSWAVTLVGLAASLALSVVLFGHARQLDRHARSTYAHAVCDGLVSTATLDSGVERSGRRKWQLSSENVRPN